MIPYFLYQLIYSPVIVVVISQYTLSEIWFNSLVWDIFSNCSGSCRER